jgi:hypothetical protein
MKFNVVIKNKPSKKAIDNFQKVLISIIDKSNK